MKYFTFLLVDFEASDLESAKVFVQLFKNRLDGIAAITGLHDNGVEIDHRGDEGTPGSELQCGDVPRYCTTCQYFHVPGTACSMWDGDKLMEIATHSSKLVPWWAL